MADMLNDKSEYWSETFENADFSNQTITSIEFDGCTFKGCDFSDSVFDHCNFVDCEFTNCNLTLAKLDYSKFADVQFHACKLIGIDWAKANWSKFIFDAPIKFYKSILNDGSLFGLSMRELVLEECKAHNVDFREADLSESNFTYTDFTGSFFDNTNLSECDFSEATEYDIDIYRNEIKQAKFSRYEAVRLLSSLDIELLD